jgi:hypothetical protein
MPKRPPALIEQAEGFAREMERLIAEERGD